jgi:hypothetical protein
MTQAEAGAPEKKKRQAKGSVPLLREDYQFLCDKAHAQTEDEAGFNRLISSSTPAGGGRVEVSMQALLELCNLAHISVELMISASEEVERTIETEEAKPNVFAGAEDVRSTTLSSSDAFDGLFVRFRCPHCDRVLEVALDADELALVAEDEGKKTVKKLNAASADGTVRWSLGPGGYSFLIQHTNDTRPCVGGPLAMRDRVPVVRAVDAKRVLSADEPLVTSKSRFDSTPPEEDLP